jgi:hypothetical protein
MSKNLTKERTEELALKAYPDIPLPHYGEGVVAKQAHLRNAYIKGYHQAEKDNELTWEDMALINQIHFEVMSDIDPNVVRPKEIHEKVLRLFKQRRGLKHLTAANELAENLLKKLKQEP